MFFRYIISTKIFFIDKVLYQFSIQDVKFNLCLLSNLNTYIKR